MSGDYWHYIHVTELDRWTREAGAPLEDIVLRSPTLSLFSFTKSTREGPLLPFVCYPVERLGSVKPFTHYGPA